jgi:hypothetical protein
MGLRCCELGDQVWVVAQEALVEHGAGVGAAM